MTSNHHRGPSRRRRNHLLNGVLEGTIAGVLAGIFLSLTNVAVDYWRRPKLVLAYDSVDVVSGADPIHFQLLGVSLIVRNVGGTPVGEGYFHIAVPAEYDPKLFFGGSPMESDGTVQIDGRQCIDFWGQIKNPIYPEAPFGVWHLTLGHPATPPGKVYYYFSTPRGLQPNRLEFAGEILYHSRPDISPPSQTSRIVAHYAELQISKRQTP